MANNECTDLVIDYNVGQCRMYKGCQERMITDQWPPKAGCMPRAQPQCGLMAIGMPGNTFEYGGYSRHSGYGKKTWENSGIDWDHWRFECPRRNNY